MNPRPEPAAESPRDADRLAHALAALKRTSVPEGPSEEVLARTLAAIRAASGARPTTIQRWRKPMLTFLKISAAALAAAGGWFLASSPALVGAPITFEEVAAKLQGAHTLSYTMTTRLGDEAAPQAVKLFFKEPGRMRTESVPAGAAVVVSDTVAARKLILDPAAKTALLLEGNLPGESRPGQPDLAASEVEGLRQLAQKKGEPVGEKMVGGVKAQGFRVVEGQGSERVVWADPQTRLPIEVETSGTFGGKAIRSTMADIRLDLPLDDALFRLEPPAGYALQKQSLAADAKDDGSPEAAIAILLRAYAGKSDGAFPKRLDDWRALAEALKPGPDEPAQAVAMRTANLVARAAVLLYIVKDVYGYQTEGVKLGDAEKVVFWYRPPGKASYRALHGDLTFKDATEAQVPSPLKPPAKP